MKRFATALAILVLSSAVSAIDAGVAFEDPELQARYDKIIEEVRCLMCQNESIRDSNAFLAADLRREIRRMIGEGMTDDEIYDFLVERYGDFALYRPRASGKTLILWIVPGALLLGGVLVVASIVRRRMAMPIDGPGDAD